MRIKYGIKCIFPSLLLSSFAILLLCSYVLISSVQFVHRPKLQLSVQKRNDICTRLLFQTGELKAPAHRDPKISCEDLFEGDFYKTCQARRIHAAQAGPDYQRLLGNCSSFVQTRHYRRHPLNFEEQNYPIAFVILAHTDFHQLERLVRMIYHPQNQYCIHVDKKSTGMESLVRDYSKCFTNIFVPETSFYVHWGGFGVLNATLLCMQELLSPNRPWNYVINLSGHDLPLKTNGEIIRFAKSLNQQNHAEVKLELRSTRYRYSYHEVTNKHGIPIESVRTEIPKSPPPEDLVIFKGNLAAVLSRSFVQWVLTNETAQRYVEWLKDTEIPDEHLWPTMLGNVKLGVPGGFSAQQQYLARYATWSYASNSCRGKFVHDVCVYGVEDMQYLIKLPHLFVNKVFLNFEAMTFDCMEKWFMENKM